MKKFLFLSAMLLSGIGASAQVLTDGTEYYFQNAENGGFLAGGNSWGTQASTMDRPQSMKAELLGDGTYKLDTHTYNDATSHYLGLSGGDVYVDNAGVAWTVETVTGGCHLIYDGKYLTAGALGAKTTLEESPSDASVWKYYTIEDVNTRANAALPTNPIDVTEFIKNPAFRRNMNAQWWPSWTMSNYAGDGNAANLTTGGGGGAAAGESFMSSNGFKVTQTIENMAMGVYRLDAHAFYQQRGSIEAAVPVIKLNEESSPFIFDSGTSGSMDAAAASFRAGNYAVEPLWIQIGDGGSLTITIEGEVNSYWCIWSQLKLTYYGACTIDQAKNGGIIAEWNEYKAAYDAKAALLDDAGQAKYAETTIELPTTQEALNTAKATLAQAYLTAVKVQGPGSDMSALLNNTWTCTQGNGPASNQTGFETYGDNSFTEGKVMYSTLTGLKPGTYEVQFYGMTHLADWNGQTGYGSGIAQAYANIDNIDVDVIHDKGGVLVSDENLRTITCGVQKDGVLEYGLQNITAGGCWYVCQSYKLTYVSDEVPFVSQNIVTQDGEIYKTLAKNIVVNGSFDDGLEGWLVNNYSKDAATSGTNMSIIPTGGYDGGAYVKSAPGAKGNDNALMGKWNVEGGKTYYICAYTSGTAPNTQNLGYNNISKLSENLEETAIKQLNWPATTDEWALTECIYKPTENGMVALRLAWNSDARLDGVQIYEVEYVGTDLDAKKEIALEAVEALKPIGDQLFCYAQTDIDDYKAAVEAATTVAELEALTLPTLQEPQSDKRYHISNLDNGYDMHIGGNAVTAEEGSASVIFTKVQNGWALSNTEGEYIKKGSNNWTLNTTTDLAQAYVITFAVLEDGTYSLHEEKGYFGMDNNDKNVYGNKAITNHGKWNIGEVALETVNFAVEAKSFATIVTPFAIDLANAPFIKAYTVSGLESDGITLATEEINPLVGSTGCIIPAYTPLILENTNDANWEMGWEGYTEEPAPGVVIENNIVQPTDDNWLAGVLAGEVNAPANSYVMQKHDELVAFWHVVPEIAQPMVSKGHCYLEVPAQTSSVKMFRLGTETTGIKFAPAASSQQVIYNLAGQRIQKAQRGINIINGKKVLK